MFCIFIVATNKAFEGYIKLIIFAACLFSWQIKHSVASCPPNWSENGGSCYTVITNNQPFSDVYEARQTCLQDGGDLASLTSSADELYIYQLVLNMSTPAPFYTYIGMTDLGQEGNFTWLDQTPVTYQNFSGPQPDNLLQYNGEHCVAIHSSDKLWQHNGMTSWVDVPCCFQEYQINSVACKKPLIQNITIERQNDTIHEECFGACLPGWYKYKGRCYGLLSTTGVFNNSYYARDTCLAHSADLPRLDSQNISYHITSIMRQKANNTADKLYLGINDITTERAFQFLDGSQLSISGYDNWATDHPQINNTENCVILASVDKLWSNDSNMTAWRDINCCNDNGVSWVMCEKPETVNASPVVTDNNVFAQECYGHKNECDSNPCNNGATCEDHVLYYQCACVPGYTGVNCETQIDFCESNPCQNGAQCQKEVNGYNCLCTPGYNDTHCENLYDHCLAFDPCQNNATCTNQITHSNCTCVPGFEGLQCETNIDECKNLTCLNNGTCIDQINSAFCACPTEFSGTHCETELSCIPGNPTVENATQTVVGVGAIPDGGIDFQCIQGQKFPDMAVKKSIKCTPNGWDIDPNTIPPCEPHCDSLPVVSNSVALNQNTKVGTVLNYTCDTGYQLYDNTTGFNITCLPGGNWSMPLDTVPQCEIVNCPELPVYPYQTLNKRNTTYNTTVTFWCDVGYVLHDYTTARTIKCLADGQWTATLPPCNPVECPVIDLPTGLTRNDSAHVYNTYVRYTCNNDLRMRDGATYRIIKCDASKQWSDNVTDCRNDRCFPLPFVANATPSDTLAIFGHKVTLNCIRGHRFNPGTTNKKASEIMTCLGIARWSPLLSACGPLYCPNQPTNKNSKANTSNTLFGTVADVQCDKGHYYPDGTNSVIMECYDDIANDQALWNVTNIDPCWPTVCVPPPTVSNGSQITPTPSNYNYSQKIEYKCDPDFKFIDGLQSRVIQCNEFGQWNQSDVSCRKDRCDPVPAKYMAVPDTTNTSWYTVVTYQCDIGHHWTGNILKRAIECTDRGFWNHTNIPDCIINECAPSPVALNTTRNDTVQHVYNTFVQYTCDTGFKYSDETDQKTRWCAPDKLWKPINFPSCQIKHCPMLTDVENATRDTNDTEYNTLAAYNCEEGYQFPDKSRSKGVYCTANETWTDLPPPCEVVFCPPLPYWDADFNSTDNNFLSVVTYKCKSGEAFTDSNKDPTVEKSSKCLEAKIWDPPIEACKPIDSIAKDLIGVTYDSEEAVPIGTIACSLMCLMMAALILLDLNKIMEDLKMMKNNVESMMNADKNKVSDSNANIKEAAESTA